MNEIDLDESSIVSDRKVSSKTDPKIKAYLTAITITAVFCFTLIFSGTKSTLLALLLALPAAMAIKQVLDAQILKRFPCRPVQRLELAEGIPDTGKTICIIVARICCAADVVRLSQKLEQHLLCNRDSGKNLFFGIVAEAPDCRTVTGDTWAALANDLARRLVILEGRNNTSLFLFARNRTFNSSEACYMGWERKRGALLELMRLMRGKSSGMTALQGDLSCLSDIRYLITLDADTDLNIGAAKKMVGAMLHPSNHPVIDNERKIVVRGHGVLQPRMGTNLHSANKSLFARLFAGEGGVDPYSCACSDFYQDVFDEGTFVGKGILDIDAFLTCLNGRFQDNTVLSHDLLEGSYLRAGLISDVVLTDGHPNSVLSYFSRLHRWVRGDIQNTLWLSHRVRSAAGDLSDNPLSLLSKWKITENLVRALTPVFTFISILAGMYLNPIILVLAGAAYLFPVLCPLVGFFKMLLRRGCRLASVKKIFKTCAIAGVELILLPYQAWNCVSAILTALWRMAVSRKKLLQWTTASEEDSKTNRLGLTAYYRKMAPAVMLSAVCLVPNFKTTAPVIVLWSLSPIIAWYLSRLNAAKAPEISKDEQDFLVGQLSRMWLYFKELVTPETHWLPPDNCQEYAGVGPTQRTSPTNIGLALLCYAAAAEMALISRKEALVYIRNTISTVQRLPKWHGHLYNWYETTTLVPILPRFVSTVDSGNFCGCLIALVNILQEWGEADLSAQASVLAAAMCFTPLYDGQNSLFYIGYNLETESYSKEHYDFLASEARLASYIAIARGDVPKEHWEHLARTSVHFHGLIGLQSWSGTMFEYLMPNLFLPLAPRSLMKQSARSCVAAQKHWIKKRNAPWGISESGYLAFDTAASYQYKAHGIPCLGLMPKLKEDLVIAPYASYLALAVDPHSAIKNLKRIYRRFGCGRYGLYEAIDFTAARTDAPAVIRSHMVHHIGMSILAIWNLLSHNALQTDFMKSSEIAACQELLDEKEFSLAL